MTRRAWKGPRPQPARDAARGHAPPACPAGPLLDSREVVNGRVLTARSGVIRQTTR